MTKRRIRSRRPRLAGIVVAAMGAASLAVVPALSGPGAPAREYLRGYEPPALAGHLHDRAAFIRADARRLARCAEAGVAVTERGRCPRRRQRAQGTPVPAGGDGQTARVAGAALAPLAVEDDGRWGEPFSLPVIGINSVVLATGKVLMFAYPTADLTQNEATAWVWNPVTRTSRRVDPPTNPATGRPYNIWCAGQAVLGDGRVLVAGGNLEYPANGLDFKGLKTLLTFDPFTETWTKQPDMAHGRWYPTVTTLPDGRAIIYNGYDEQGLSRINQDVEVFTPSASPGGVGSARAEADGATLQRALPTHVRRARREGAAGRPGPDRGAPRHQLVDLADRSPCRRPIASGAARCSSRAARGAPPHSCWWAGPTFPRTRTRSPPRSRSTYATRGRDGARARPWSSGARTTTPSSSPTTRCSRWAAAPGATMSSASGPAPSTSPSCSTQGLGWRSVGTEIEERTYHSTAVLLPDGRVLAAGDDRPGARYADNGELY